jgi:hypothetical protein
MLPQTYSTEVVIKANACFFKSMETRYTKHSQIASPLGALVDIHRIETESKNNFVQEPIFQRLQFQQGILANIGVTDEKSAIAYLDKIEAAINEWFESGISNVLQAAFEKQYSRKPNGDLY